MATHPIQPPLHPPSTPPLSLGRKHRMIRIVPVGCGRIPNTPNGVGCPPYGTFIGGCTPSVRTGIGWRYMYMYGAQECGGRRAISRLNVPPPSFPSCLLQVFRSIGAYAIVIIPIYSHPNTSHHHPPPPPTTPPSLPLHLLFLDSPHPLLSVFVPLLSRRGSTPYIRNRVQLQSSSHHAAASAP